jgi:antitoxin VapB
MTDARAKLFTHGGSQAVRLPKAFRFSGTEVRVRRDGDRVILEPVGYDPEVFWARIDACLDSDPPEQKQPFSHLAFANLAVAHLAAVRSPAAPDAGAVR